MCNSAIATRPASSFFQNFSRWVDAAFHDHFVQCGLPPWREMASLPGCAGALLLEVHSRFHTSATYGESLGVHTSTEEWRDKVFIQRHLITHGEMPICEFPATRGVMHQASRRKPQSGHDTGFFCSHRMLLKGSFGPTQGRAEWLLLSADRSDERPLISLANVAYWPISAGRSSARSHQR
jgi:acyl-CoA thioesterase FadM